MTAEAAIFNFFEDFGLTVVREGSVYSGGIRAKLPYIIIPDFCRNGAGEKQERSLEIWYRDGLDWQSPAEVESLIAQAVPLSGTNISFDGGSLHLRRSKPFSKTLPQPKDPMLKGIRINLTYEYIYPYRKVTFTANNTPFIFGEGCEIIVQDKLCGGRAESVSGKISLDCFGRRREIRILTDWIGAVQINMFSIAAANTPVMTVTYPYDVAAAAMPMTGEFIVDMPIIKEMSRTGNSLEYVKAEIRAVSKEVWKTW